MDNKEIYEVQPDRNLVIKGGWRVESFQSEDQNKEIYKKLFSELPRYNIITYDGDGEEVGRSDGCVGNRSLEYWFKYHVSRIRKLAILTENLVMARHNSGCYRGKPEYIEQYEEEVARIEILAQWINKIKNNEL